MSTSLGTKEKIAQIIASRDPLLKEIRSRRKALYEVSQAISMLETQRERMVDDGSPLMKSNLSGISLKALRTRIDEEYRKLEKPERRFQRTTLNIGVLGYSGQGKSTFLRSVSGLLKEDEDVIPTGSGGACTGARSLIIHDNNPQNMGATITFYSEREFLAEVLAPYYEILHLKVAHPYSLDDFERTAFPPKLDDITFYDETHSAGHHSLADMHKMGKQTLQGIYDQFLVYHQHIKEYRDLLHMQPLEKLAFAQARAYIAQEDKNENPLYYYLAVKEAVIRKNFGNLDVQQVGLLDIPGLGGLRIADQQRLEQALKEDIDVVLFFNMPSPDRVDIGGADLALYDLVRDTFEGLSLKESSFAVINHKQSTDPDADNKKNCGRLKKQIDALQIVQKCYIVNCKDSQSTKQEILVPILEYLETHMTQYLNAQVSHLDKTYMVFWDERYEQLKKDIAVMLDTITPSSPSTGTFDVGEETLYIERFNSLWLDLRAALEGRLSLQLAQSKSTNSTFTQYFQQKLALCRNDTGIASIEKITIEGQGERKNYVKLFSEQINIMRTHFTGHFKDIDEQLGIHMEEVKKEVARTFLEAGRLEKLYPGIRPEDLFKRMVAEPALSSHLQETLREFIEFNLQGSGYVQTLILEGFLNIMYPDVAIMRYLVSNYVSPRLTRLHGQFKLDDKNWMQLVNIIITFIVVHATAPNAVVALMSDISAVLQLDESTKNALKEAIKSLFLAETQKEFTVFEPRQIFEALHIAHRDTLDMITQNLQTFYSLPERATIAAVQDLLDQTLYAPGVRDQWGIFYRAHRPTIWSAEFSQIGRWQTYQQQWQKCVAEVKEAARHL